MIPSPLYLHLLHNWAYYLKIIGLCQEKSWVFLNRLGWEKSALLLTRAKKGRRKGRFLMAETTKKGRFPKKETPPCLRFTNYS
jgi:hypothetical protein